jgi:hypothetical protein
MDELQKIVKGINLPISLPENAFMTLGKNRIPDFGFIMQQYLSPLLSYIDMNVTVPPGGGPGSYLLPLIDRRYLKITLRENELVGLELVG